MRAICYAGKMEPTWITLVLLSLPSVLNSPYVPCDRNFMGRMGSGIITSPNFPLDYPAATSGTCIYLIYSNSVSSHLSPAQKSKVFTPTNDQDSTKSPEQDTVIETAADKLKTPPLKTGSRFSQTEIDEEKAQEVVAYSSEVVCFTFHRFSLSNSPDDCTIFDSSHAYLEFQGTTIYCNKGSKSTKDTGTDPSSVYDENFCWQMKYGFVEMKFVFPDSGDKSKTDTGFYATFKVFYQPPKMSPGNLFRNATSYVTKAPCPADNYTCFDRGCTPQKYLCNGRWNCEDGSDEDYINARCAGRQSYAGCDFELTDGIEFETCHMRGVNWVRDTMSPYGPRYDHTIGRTQGPGHFMYTVFSFPTLVLKSAKNITAPTTPIPRCFRFWYFMSGGDIGSLGVFINATTPEVSPEGMAWLREGHQGSMWHMGEVDIPPYVQEISELGFQARKGSSHEVSLAIDDLSMMNGTCYGDDISCTFELGTCGWQIEDSVSSSPWVRQNGMESVGSAPATDCNGDAEGFFMTYNFSGHPQARMVSRPVSSNFNSVQRLWCLSFCYQIDGPDSANYHVRLKYGDGDESTGTWDDVKTGKQWKTKKWLLYIEKPAQVIFETVRMTTGTNVQVSLDNIVLVPSGWCDVPATPPPIRTTTTSGPVQCRDGYFPCRDGQKCVSRARVCDGRADCNDRSDEVDCGIAGLSVGAIAGIVSAILVVLVVTLTCFLWTKKRAERPNNHRNTNNENIVPDDEFLSAPMTYGEAPPLYSEARNHGSSSDLGLDGPHMDPWAYPGGLQAYHASQALAWEPPPAYEASQGHSCDNVVVPEAPCYSPRLDPPPFESVVDSSEDVRGQEGHRKPDGNKEEDSLGPAVRDTNNRQQGMPHPPRPNPTRNSHSSTGSNHDYINIPQAQNGNITGAPQFQSPHSNGEPSPTAVIASAPTLDPATAALIGAPATGQDLQRYYNPRPIVYQIPSRHRHTSRGSFRRSFRRSRRRSRNRSTPSNHSGHQSAINMQNNRGQSHDQRGYGFEQEPSSEV